MYRLMVKTTQKSDPPWSAIFSVIVYLCSFQSFKYKYKKFHTMFVAVFVSELNVSEAGCKSHMGKTGRKFL